MAGLDPNHSAVPLISGAFAGFTVDIALFPIDTIKTRLQAKEGFLKSGGFRGIYRGLGSAAAGSIPAASAFFYAYDTAKKSFSNVITDDVALHSAAGCVAETFACAIRIPFEVVKQTAQANPRLTSNESMYRILNAAGFGGLFRGYFSMVFRDVPFSILQMPMWEFFKSRVRKYNLSSTGSSDISGLQSGACGSLSGGIAAAITTPMDVVKTRIILSQKYTQVQRYSENPVKVMLQIAREEGAGKLYSGIAPRVVWLSAGGFLFFGSYEFCRNMVTIYDII